jgi:hypothetical protein
MAHHLPPEQAFFWKSSLHAWWELQSVIWIPLQLIEIAARCRRSIGTPCAIPVGARKAMSSMNRIILVIALLVTPALLYAQGTDDNQGVSFSQRFQGSSNALGVILKTTSTATYSFNEHIRAYAGVPFYFTKEASSTSFVNGLGNVYSGLFLTAGSPSAIRYASDLVFTLPTGDVSGGFSTGHTTVDWTNTLSHSFGALIPYGSVGIANTISDTEFFVRRFASDGVVTHFEAGALVSLNRLVTVGGSAYGVRASGAQEIINQGRQGTTRQTIGPIQVANDNGFSSWVSVKPTLSTDFQIGYSRSEGYGLNSLFFGVGFHFGHGVPVIK